MVKRVTRTSSEADSTERKAAVIHVTTEVTTAGGNGTVFANDNETEFGPTTEKMILQIRPEDFPVFLERHAVVMIRSDRPWTDYMRKKFTEHGILQQDVFLAADLSEKYGYKLISGEKRTHRRDTILRICLAAEFELQEVQEALRLYGMAPLYWRIPRDAAFMVAFHNRIYDIHDVDAILRENNLPPFLLE